MANEKQIDNLVELLDGYAEKGGTLRRGCR